MPSPPHVADHQEHTNKTQAFARKDLNWSRPGSHDARIIISKLTIRRKNEKNQSKRNKVHLFVVWQVEEGNDAGIM